MQVPTQSKQQWPFSPQCITGLALWLDSADPSSMTFSGSSVTQWNDKSGNSRNATILSGYTGATYSSTQNGLYFPNSTTGYETSYSANPTNETMFVVFNNPSPSFYNNMVIGGPPGARALSGGYSGTTGVGACSYLDNEVTWSGIASMPASTYTSGSTVIITGQVINSSSSSISQNGGTIYTASGTAFDFATVNTYIGTDTGYSPPLFYYIGYIMEIIFYNSVLSTSQRQQVEGYLAVKWGLQSDLPITHPYCTPSPPPYNRTFQPVDISGCALWLDGADQSSIVFSSENIVSVWNDKSGNSADSTSAGYNITYSSSGLYFGGVNYYMNVPGIAGTIANTPFVIFIVETLDATGNNMYILGDDTFNGEGANLLVGYRNDTDFTMAFYGSDIDYTGVSGTNNRRIWTCYLPASTNRTIRLNGETVTIGDNNTQLGAFTTPVLGRVFGAYGNFYYTGTMYEILIYNKDIGLSQIQQVEAYLAWKWNLRSSLPSTHPGYTLPSFSTVFTPKSIQNMVLWLDAADPFTITLSGSSVTQWSDKSGNEYVATPLDSAITTTTLNGTTALLFGGNRMSIPNFTWNMSFTSIMVWNAYYASQMIGLTASTSPSAAWYDYISTGNWALIYLNASTSSTDPNYVRVPPDPYAGSPAPVVTGNQWFIFSIGYTAGTTTITNYAVNGTARTANAVTAQTGTNTGAYFINGLSNGAYDYSQVAEIIHYNTSLSSSERQEVEGYLAWKWGLQSLLPSTHAFKKFKP